MAKTAAPPPATPWGEVQTRIDEERGSSYVTDDEKKAMLRENTAFYIVAARDVDSQWGPRCEFDMVPSLPAMKDDVRTIAFSHTDSRALSVRLIQEALRDGPGVGPVALKQEPTKSGQAFYVFKAHDPDEIPF